MLGVYLNPTLNTFIFLVIFVSMLILLYIKYYIVKELNFYRYMITMLVFIRRMVSLLTSLTFITILISWEILGVSSFLLIFYYNTWESQANAIVTIITIRVGEFCLFLSISLMLIINLINLAFYFYRSLSYIFFIIFSFTKRAQYPFRRWLPKAIRAPTPTRALVHSSTLVTAGLVVIVTYREILITGRLLLVLIVGGTVTIIMGRCLAVFERRVKKVVAYSTLSQIGLATIVFGLGNFHVGLLNLVSHGFAKSLLFIQVGYVIHIINLQQNTRT